jgi:hypothetical protein
MTQDAITEYFKEIAANFKPISHTSTKHRFAEMDADTIAEEVKDKLDFTDWCLLLEETTPKVKANEANALNEYRYFRYTVCKSATGLDAAQRKAIYNQAEIYGKHIFMKILKDYRESRVRKNPTKIFALRDIESKFDMEKYADILNEDIIGIDTAISIKEPFKEADYNDPTLWN